MYVVVCCFMNVTTPHWVVLSESSFTKYFFSLVCNKEVTTVLNFSFSVFRLHDNTTRIHEKPGGLHRKARRRRTDYKVLVGHLCKVWVMDCPRYFVSFAWLFPAFSYPRTPSSVNGDSLHFSPGSSDCLLTCILVVELPVAPLGPLRKCLPLVVLHISILTPISHPPLCGRNQVLSVVFEADWLDFVGYTVRFEWTVLAYSIRLEWLIARILYQSPMIACIPVHNSKKI